ncbi:MAG: Ig-like domain-containing protein [Chryseolinea sp.]
MKPHKHIHWLVYLLFVLSCARQTTPTGGPKDTIPPIFKTSNPKSQQINFQGTQVELIFNEALQLNNPKEQIIIIPEVGKDFDAVAKKNRVIVTFKKPLLDTTTYSLNFRDAIQDLTEKNPAKNIQLAFSTGSYIDSLSISGYVYDMLTSKPIKEGTVALFKQDTFNIFRHKATVFTKTNDKGQYKIANLKPGIYKLYALLDNNKNLIIDSRSEAYGYATQSIQLDSNIINKKIPLTRLDARPLKITSGRPSQSFFNIKLSKNLQTYTIHSPPDQTMLSSFGADQENVRVYNTAEIKDSVKIRFQANDSLMNKIDTTLYAKFVERKLKPEVFKTSSNGFAVSATHGTLSGSLTFNKPIVKVNFDSLYYRIDSLNTIKFSPTDLKLDSIHNTLHIQKTITKSLLAKKDPLTPPNPTANKTETKIPPTPMTKPTSNKKLPPPKPKPQDYQLYLGKAAFISAEADSSLKLTEVITPVTPETTGTFLVEIKTLEPHYIVDIISKNKIVASKYSQPKLTFDDLPPGDYQIRLTIDTNNDHKWSPGNYFRKEPPEAILFYISEKKLDTINLKANFEIGPLLITF